MKTILITFITPASENIGGTSALPYHLMVERDKNIDVTIYSFNNNGLSDEKIAEVEKELLCTIKKVSLPVWYRWMFKLHLLFLRILFKYPFINYIMLPQRSVDEIKAEHPDLIWVYQEELSRIVKQFPKFRRIHIGPDTESLYYYRMMGRRFVMNNVVNYWKCAMMYRKYARMERDFCTDKDFTYYAVGEGDVRHLQQLNPKIQAKFLRHPHYEVSKLRINNEKLRIRFHQAKIKLLIAGQYNLYMKQDVDLLVERLCSDSNDYINIKNNLQKNYHITFLGKGWEEHVKTLRMIGYEVTHITFAPDYIEEVCKHDIQITPISIGTGTKGKVLDALANGLLVIGTPYAMENIAVENGVSCIEYNNPQEVINILNDIPNNRHIYEAMAEEGRKCVLTHHNRAKISRELFALFHK